MDHHKEAHSVETQPEDSREELTRSLHRIRLLMDACDEWLRDAQNPEAYNLGLRADEVTITYLLHEDEGRPKKAKATLAELLTRVDTRFERERVEPRFADPRNLILKTAQELRQTVRAGTDLARLLADAQAMQTFRERLLAEIAEVDEDLVGRIEEAIRRCPLPGASAPGDSDLPPEPGRPAPRRSRRAH